jgi:hypothetical protein
MVRYCSSETLQPRDLLAATAFHRRGVRISAKSERRRERRVSETEEQQLLDACKLLNEPTRGMAKLTWADVREIRARAKAGIQQSKLAAAFRISRPLCNEIVRVTSEIRRRSSPQATRCATASSARSTRAVGAGTC